jgi:hypothetical protein
VLYGYQPAGVKADIIRDELIQKTPLAESCCATLQTVRLLMGKIKVKVTLVEALRLCTGCSAHTRVEV